MAILLFLTPVIISGNSSVCAKRMLHSKIPEQGFYGNVYILLTYISVFFSFLTFFIEFSKQTKKTRKKLLLKCPNLLIDVFLGALITSEILLVFSTIVFRNSQLSKQYVRLIRNQTLKLNSDNTRICFEHFRRRKKKNNKIKNICPYYLHMTNYDE